MLANVLARQQAVEQGCAEALLIRDGYVKEGAASNVFLVRNGILLTPPKTQLMLPGITYDVILEFIITSYSIHYTKLYDSPFESGAGTKLSRSRSIIGQF